MLSEIYEMFSDVLANDWVSQMQNWCDRVRLCREYALGQHRMEITTEMANLLRIDETDVLDHFNANYMQKVVDAMSDRLIVSNIRVVSGDETAQGWVDALLDVNRWDGLQMDLHEAVVRDGDSFLMASWDEKAGRVRLVHELAYDGDWGMIPIYARSDRTQLYAAAKVVGMGDDEYMVYVYYHDRVETYRSESAHGGLKPHHPPSKSPPTMQGETSAESYMQGNAAEVIPIVHYRNRPNTLTGMGTSELIAGIPLNDVINRTIMSMVAASELSAFQIMYIMGADAPSEVTPGMILRIGKEGIPKDELYMPVVGTVPQNSPVPFLEVIDSMIDKISDVTSTPIHLGGVAQSGEALKQREIALLSKVRRAQVKVGNKHEDMVDLAAAIARTFGTGGVPDLGELDTEWADAQMRNDAEVVVNAEKTFGITNDVEGYLENVSSVYGWSMDDRMRILQRIQQQRADVLRFSVAPELNFGAVLEPEAESA